MIRPILKKSFSNLKASLFRSTFPLKFELTKKCLIIVDQCTTYFLFILLNSKSSFHRSVKRIMRKTIKTFFKIQKNTNLCLKHSLYVGTASNLILETIFCSPLPKKPSLCVVLCCYFMMMVFCDLTTFLFHSIVDRKEGEAYLCMPSCTSKTFSVGGMHHFTLKCVCVCVSECVRVCVCERVCVCVCVCESVCQATIILVHLFSCEVQNSSLSFSLIHSAIYLRYFLPFLWNRILKLYSCVSFRYSSIFCQDDDHSKEHRISLCLEMDYFWKLQTEKLFFLRMIHYYLISKYNVLD